MAKLDKDQWKALAVALMQVQPPLGLLKEGVDIWARSGFKCEYCQTDLLKDFETYQSAEADHILPQSKYKQLSDKLNNYAMACGPCNQLKRGWDPAETKAPAFAELNDLTDEQRAMLIKRCSDHLEPMQRQARGKYDRVREFLQIHSLR